MLSTLGRLLLAIPMAIFGVFHLMNAGNVSAMVPAYLPGGIVWVYITGIALLAAALAIILQKWARTAAILLAIMLISFAIFVHLPSFLEGNEKAMGSLLKDLGIAGGALILANTEKD
ncbi:DoxX family protein [Runella rosea]|uniref:DoxX family protein n=1 Tax=Runella rosea TaxID=2259595 RepID=A0A344TR57_9BACT|nr:DoxX family membrane protein [Runella rosea]AXE21128.1 DoxX family protein [Runella rosea]